MGGRTPLHLVSLFDGWGLARLAIGDLVHKLGATLPSTTEKQRRQSREDGTQRPTLWTEAPAQATGGGRVGPLPPARPA
eukprot:6140035-Pyramimonas_sp.AAC.1